MNRKSVRFNEEDNKVQYIYAWSFAYREARKRFWEFFVTDRCRFKERISRSEDVFCKYLDEAHRMRIYNERFKEDCGRE